MTIPSARRLGWSDAWMAFRGQRNLAIILVIALIPILLAAWPLGRGSMAIRAFFGLAAMILGIGLSARIVSGDRQSGAWVLLFQKAGSAHAHYRRSALIAAAAGAGVIGAGAALLFVVAWVTGTHARLVWGSAVAALAWMTLLLIVGTGISSLVRKYDLELLILYFLASIFQGVVTLETGMPTLRPILNSILFPVDALGQLGETLTLGERRLSWQHSAQLVLYPVIVWSFVEWRLRQLPHRWL